MVIRADRQANARLNRRRERAKSMAPHFCDPRLRKTLSAPSAYRCGDHASRIEAVISMPQSTVPAPPSGRSAEISAAQCGRAFARISRPSLLTCPVLQFLCIATLHSLPGINIKGPLVGSPTRKFAITVLSRQLPLTMMVMMSGANPAA